MNEYKNNPTDDYELVFNSEDLSECLEYFYKKGDIEHLRLAISLQAKKIRELKDYAKQTENTFLLKKLQKL